MFSISCLLKSRLGIRLLTWLTTQSQNNLFSSHWFMTGTTKMSEGYEYRYKNRFVEMGLILQKWTEIFQPALYRIVNKCYI